MFEIIKTIIEDITIECKLDTDKVPLQKISYVIEKKTFEPEIKEFIIVCNRDKTPPNNYITSVFKNGKFIVSKIKRFEDIDSIKKKIIRRLKEMGLEYKITDTRIRESVVRYELKEEIGDISDIAKSIKCCEYNKKIDALICHSKDKSTKNAYFVLISGKKDIVALNLEDEKQIKEFKDFIEKI